MHRCLSTKQYYLARQLLQQDIYELGGTGLQSADYLLYCFYGAKACIAVKDVPAAFRLLELACTAPTSVGDAIMLAAWHLYQLVFPLHMGAPVAMPLCSVHTPVLTQLVSHRLRGRRRSDW